MVIQIDTREKARAIRQIVRTFDAAGIKHYTSKLLVGDYMSLDNPYVIVDRKQNLLEVCNNVCQDHDRFMAELLRAKDVGIKLIVLVEHGEGINSLEDVIFWENPRREKSPKAINGDRLYKILQTVERKYGCTFAFCDKRHTGEEIIRWLTTDGYVCTGRSEITGYGKTPKS